HDRARRAREKPPRHARRHARGGSMIDRNSPIWRAVGKGKKASKKKRARKKRAAPKCVMVPVPTETDQALDAISMELSDARVELKELKLMLSQVGETANAARHNALAAGREVERYFNRRASKLQLFRLV